MRFRDRHVEATIAAYVRGGLSDLGWVSEPINFGATPLTWVDEVPTENSDVQVAPNTVAMTFGDIGEEGLEQLGGGLYSLNIPVFFDVFGDNGTIARCICSDILDLLKRDKVIPTLDWTTGTGDQTAETILFDVVMGPERPPASEMASSGDFRKHWRVVKATAVVTYQD